MKMNPPLPQMITDAKDKKRHIIGGMSETRNS